MTTYSRLADVRKPRRLHVVAGRPVTLQPLGNPLADHTERQAHDYALAGAAAFADRVVLVLICLVFGVFVLPDLIAWALGLSPVWVTR
jgi:hypothetical protein